MSALVWCSDPHGQSPDCGSTTSLPPKLDTFRSWSCTRSSNWYVRLCGLPASEMDLLCWNACCLIMSGWVTVWHPETLIAALSLIWPGASLLVREETGLHALFRLQLRGGWFGGKTYCLYDLAPWNYLLVVPGSKYKPVPSYREGEERRYQQVGSVSAPAPALWHSVGTTDGPLASLPCIPWTADLPEPFQQLKGLRKGREMK